MPMRDAKGREVENWMVKTPKKNQFIKLRDDDPDGRTNYEIHFESMGVDMDNDYQFIMLNDPTNTYETYVETQAKLKADQVEQETNE